MTDSARKAVGASPDVPDEEVAYRYLEKQQDRLGTFKGFSEAPMSVQEALLDTAYNTSAGEMSKWKGMKKALAEGDYEKVLKETLDTANSGGKSLRGMARRRAMNYNKIARTPIATIEQKADGSIIYRDSGGNTITSYKARGGRHPQSRIGILEV